MSLRTARPRRRHCTYCPRPGADCCVRVQGDGQHVYAHRTCAAAKGVKALYVYVEMPAQPGEAQ